MTNLLLLIGVVWAACGVATYHALKWDWSVQFPDLGDRLPYPRGIMLFCGGLGPIGLLGILFAAVLRRIAS